MIQNNGLTFGCEYDITNDVIVGIDVLWSNNDGFRIVSFGTHCDLILGCSENQKGKSAVIKSTRYTLSWNTAVSYIGFYPFACPGVRYFSLHGDIRALGVTQRCSNYKYRNQIKKGVFH